MPNLVEDFLLRCVELCDDTVDVTGFHIGQLFDQFLDHLIFRQLTVLSQKLVGHLTVGVFVIPIQYVHKSP